jgi:streptogramin lyase
MARRVGVVLAVASIGLALGCGGGSGAPSSPGGNTATPGTQVRPIVRVHVGGNPCGVVAVAGGAWVSDAGHARLLRIDTKSGRVTKRVQVDDTPCEVMSAYGSLWLVTQSGRLDRFDPATGRVLARIPVGLASYEAVAAHGSVWVSNRNSGTLSQINPATNRVMRTIHLPIATPGGITYAAGQLWVGDDESGQDTVLRVDPKSGHATKVHTGARPAFVTAIGGTVWAAGQDGGSVTPINTSSSRPGRPVHACSRAVNLDVLAAEHQVWVPCDTDNVVVVIDATSRRVLRTIDVQSGPAVVAPATNGMWVTCYDAGEVELLPAG